MAVYPATLPQQRGDRRRERREQQPAAQQQQKPKHPRRKGGGGGGGKGGGGSGKGGGGSGKGGGLVFCIGGSNASSAQKSNRPFPYIAPGMLPVLSMPEIALPKKERAEQQHGPPASETLKASRSHPASFPHGNFIGGMRVSTLPSLQEKPEARSPTKDLPSYLDPGKGSPGQQESADGGGGGGGASSMGVAPSSVLSGGEAKKAYAEQFGKQARPRGFEPASQGSGEVGAMRPLRQFVDADEDDRAPPQNWLDHRGLDSRPPRNAHTQHGNDGSGEPNPEHVLAAKRRGGPAAAILSKSAAEAAEDAARNIKGGKANAMKRAHVREEKARKERERLAQKQREMEQTWQQVPTPQPGSRSGGGASVFSPPGSMGPLGPLQAVLGGDKWSESGGLETIFSKGGGSASGQGNNSYDAGALGADPFAQPQPQPQPQQQPQQQLLQPAPLQLANDYAESIADAEDRGVELSSLASKLQRDAYQRMRVVKEKEWAEQDAAKAAIKAAHEKNLKEVQEQREAAEKVARREEERKAMDAMWEEERQKNAAAAYAERLDSLADEASAAGRVSLKPSKNAVPKQQPLSAAQRRQRAMAVGGRASYGLSEGTAGTTSDMDEAAVAAYGANDALHGTPAPPSTRDPGFDGAGFGVGEDDGIESSPRSNREERKLAPAARRKKAREMAAIAARKKEDQEEFIRAMAVEVTGSTHGLETRVLNSTEIASGRGASIPPPPLPTNPTNARAPQGAGAVASPGHSVIRVINGEIVTIPSSSPEKHGGRREEREEPLPQESAESGSDNEFPVLNEAEQAAMLRRWADRGRSDADGTAPFLTGTAAAAESESSSNATGPGLVAQVNDALAGHSEKQPEQEHLPVPATSLAGGDDGFDFNARFGFDLSATGGEQEQGAEQRAAPSESTVQNSADDAADEWLRQIQMRAAVASDAPTSRSPKREEPAAAGTNRSPPTEAPTFTPFAFLRRKIKKYFDGYGLFSGQVTAFTPAAMVEEGVDLWTVVYEDDDEEQLTRAEVEEGIMLHESQADVVPQTTTSAPEEREEEDEGQAEAHQEEEEEEEEQEGEEGKAGEAEAEPEAEPEADSPSEGNTNAAAPKDDESDHDDGPAPLPGFVSPSGSHSLVSGSAEKAGAHRRSSGTGSVSSNHSAYSSDGFENEYEDEDDEDEEHAEQESQKLVSGEEDCVAERNGSTAAVNKEENMIGDTGIETLKMDVAGEAIAAENDEGSQRSEEEEQEQMQDQAIPAKVTAPAADDEENAQSEEEEEQEQEQEQEQEEDGADSEEERLKQMLAEAPEHTPDDNVSEDGDQSEDDQHSDQGDADDEEARSTTHSMSIGRDDEGTENDKEQYGLTADTFDADAALNPRSPIIPNSSGKTARQSPGGASLEHSIGSEGGYSQDDFDDDFSDEEEEGGPG